VIQIALRARNPFAIAFFPSLKFRSTAARYTHFVEMQPCVMKYLNDRLTMSRVASIVRSKSNSGPIW